MVNPDLVKQFGAKLLSIYTGGVITKLIDIGYQVGLFEASKIGPATSQQLADRAGLKERYVREWLGAMVTSGVFVYDPEDRSYALPEEHAPLLTGDAHTNIAPTSRMINHFGTHLQRLTACFRDGGGIPYSAYRPVFTQCMDDAWRRIYEHLLVSGFIPAVDGLSESLRSGIRVLDVGCGTGHAGMSSLASSRSRPSSAMTSPKTPSPALAKKPARWASRTPALKWSMSRPCQPIRSSISSLPSTRSTISEPQTPSCAGCVNLSRPAGPSS